MVFGRGLLPADLKEAMGEQATVCEKVAVVKRSSYNIPGRRVSYRISRTAGAFAFTSSRVVATLGLLLILDYEYTNVSSDAHGELLYQPDGLHVKYDVSVLPHGEGSVDLHFKRSLSDSLLSIAPSQKLYFTYDLDQLMHAIKG